MEQGEFNIWNTPNMLTGLRIAAVPVVMVLLFFPGRLASFLGGLCFMLAGATDFLDGFLARRYQVVSRVGKFLDPLADKLLVSAALIMLIPLGRVPAWMAFLIVGRELAVTGLRGLAAAEGIILAADRWGKTKTILQMAALTALIFHYPFGSVNFHQLGMVLLWPALIITLISGVWYFQAFFGQQPAGPDLDKNESKLDI
jgi:CDP-diacylglycerol--glycerol-3-phosphate 3-phosphatidyltransferase